MYIEPNKQRLKKIDITDIKDGEVIVFCPDCDFQASSVAMKPVCPHCTSGLHLTKLDSDLRSLKEDISKRHQDKFDNWRNWYKFLDGEV